MANQALTSFSGVGKFLNFGYNFNPDGTRTHFISALSQLSRPAPRQWEIKLFLWKIQQVMLKVIHLIRWPSLKNGMHYNVGSTLIERYFEQGYEEGLSEGLKSSPDEGFELGHELAFQRFLQFGIVLGRCAIWRHALSHDSRHRIVLSALTAYRTLKFITMVEGRLKYLQLEIDSEAEHVEYEEIRDDVMRRVRLIEVSLKEKRMQSRGKGIEKDDPVALAKRMDRELQL